MIERLQRYEHLMGDVDWLKLRYMGSIGGMPIPDVTMTGRSPEHVTRHAITEAEEIRQELEDGGKPGWLHDHGVIKELVDGVIMYQSALQLYAERHGRELVDTVVLEVLRKNADRGYYSADNPKHYAECDSGSLRALRAEGHA